MCVVVGWAEFMNSPQDFWDWNLLQLNLVNTTAALQL